MKIFIINLKRADAKRERMKGLLEEIGCDYEFFEAIDGSHVDTSKFKASSYWMDPYHHTHMTEGEIGCALSHFMVWKKIVESNIDRAIILEDDVEFLDDNFMEKCHAIDSDYDHVFLGRKKIGSDEEETVSDDPVLVKPMFSYWTCAYLLSLEGAKKLSHDSETFYNNIIPSDEYISHMCGMQHFDHESSLRIEKSYGPKPDNFVSLAFDPPLIKPVSDAFGNSSTFHSVPYFNSSNEVCCFSIATDRNECCIRYSDSCEKYGFNPYIMGIGKKWSGGNMAKGPGGGQKVNLLREFISTSLDDQLIVFTDNYDVIANDHVSVLVEKYRRYYDGKIVFAGETSCWPIESMASEYPKTDDETACRFLNSGLFMGYVRDVKQLVDSPIANNEDDQLYYTKKFLSNSDKIVIDYKSRLFLCLNGIVSDIEIDKSKSCIRYKNERPVFVHGNGPESIKVFLNNIVTNYCMNYNSTYGYLNKPDITNKRILYVVHETFFLDDGGHATRLLDQNYPKELIDLLIVYTTSEFSAVFDSVNKDNEYRSFTRCKASDDVWNQILTFSCGLECDLVYYQDSKANIINPRMLTRLVSQKKNAVAPLLCEEGTAYANFWGDVDTKGFYKRSSNYFSIRNRQELGCWNVPYISHAILLSKRLLTEKTIKQNEQSYSDQDMVICNNIRSNFNFMYVVNTEVWGRLDKEVRLDTICDDPSAWEVKYLAKATDNWDHENLGNNIHKLSMFNETFCNEIISLAEEKASWSQGGEKYYDKRIGSYENHPTQDIQLYELNLDKMWDKIIELYIAPFIQEQYSYDTKDVNLAFVVKYSMEGQKELRQHHDSSTYTVNLCLNRDFEGGGCCFVKTNQTVRNKDIGSVIIHPGRLTHCHKGLPITSGTRYIMVSFVN